MPSVTTAIRDKAPEKEGLFEFVARELSQLVREIRRVVNILGGDAVNISADYTAKLSDRIVYVDATAGAVGVTLYDALPAKDYKFTVKKIDASGNAVTVISDAVEFSTSVSLAAQGDVVTLHSDGTSYYVVG